MPKRLPLYELTFDDVETYVQAIALVENPAIETNFIAFSKEAIQKFSFDEEKRELFGPAMIPDQNIYRVDKDGNGYNVFFSKETIRKISQSFFKRAYQANLNIEHTDKDADCFVFQSVIVDKQKGIAPMDLPDGSWVVGVKVENDATWREIKEGKRQGFSIEGFFEMNPTQFKKSKHFNN